MNQILKRGKTIALVLALAFSLLLPATALAGDGTAPVPTLYSPTVNAATSANQKIIFSLDERVSLASGVSITISPDSGTTLYTADAASGTLLGNQSTGPWYVSYNLSAFQNGGTPLSLAVSTTYSVAVAAGAFVDSTSTGNDPYSPSFTTTDGSVTNPVALIYTITNSNQTVAAGGSAAVSGQAVANGATVVFTIPADGSYVPVHTVKVNGSVVMGANLSSMTLTGDTEVYLSRTDGTLSGSVSISGDAYYDGTLSAALSNLNQPDTSGITLTWIRQDGTTDTTLTTGGVSKTYKLTADDIGKIIRLEVTDATLTGKLTATTAAIAKAPYSGSVIAPVAASTTDTSVTLQTVSGYEYMRTGGTWQDSASFTGLTTGTAYDFYQRAKETTTTLASATSAKTTVTTAAGLTGTVNFSTTAQSGKALTASLSGSNASGTITFTWKHGTTVLTTGATYTPVAADVGQTLTVVVTTDQQSGSITATTAAVLKAANTTTPSAPTMASAAATSITLNAVSGYQYSLGGTYWQDTTSFYGLVAGSTYTFYQRVAETSTTLASAASAGVNFSTQGALSGTVMSNGEARYGSTITISLSGSNNTGTLTYTWKRGTVAVGTGTSYAVQAADISNQLSVEVTSSVQGGSVTRSFGTVAKAFYYGNTPSAPTRSSRTTSKIVLKAVSGCEYSRDGSNWQESTTFSGLSAGKSYTFYQRYAATATMEASPTSDPYKTSTSSASSDDSDSSSSTATPKPSSTAAGSTNDSGATTLYSYTLTSDNTRILYSTMKSLAAGNKAQDITIKQDNVEITFPKGSMTSDYTQLWYDFGTTINNSIAEQIAKELAGDSYVATVHFNYSGELPGEANIRFMLGAENAGKTLYYYRLEDNNKLTFMQASQVDSSGWASVTQKSCSDYVFLSSEYGAASPSPVPSPSSGISPTPTPLVSVDKPIAGMASDGWLVIAIVLIAVALIVGGIWLYTKSKENNDDDEDDDF